ncbi:MAG: efflux RND transporter periplasmic adaptor subunit [Desulforhopalus sp.]|nr:efflux RND transporter periplasmic adaptor subunit [Desulforhopalus sp.]
MLAVTVGLFLFSCKDSKQTPPPSQSGAAVFEVNTITVTSNPTSLTVELPGRTAAYRIAEVRPQVSGIVQKRLFTEGSVVKAGELLYQIDAATYQATLASAEAALAKSEAVEYSARLRSTRYMTLARNKAVSEQEQIDTEASWKQTLAEVAAAKAAVQNAKINLEYTRVVAPIAGRIGKSLVSEGALVTAQQATALATIQQVDRLYVDVSQSSNELMELKRKLLSKTIERAEIAKTEVRVVLDDNSVYSEPGVLEFSDVSVDQSTGTVTIRAIIDNPKHELLPGMFVRARLTSDQPLKTILVPQSSIVRNNRGQAMVMLVNSQSIVEARLVETGQNVEDQIVITKGLVDGEQLITAGLQKIKAGAPVKVVTAVSDSQAQSSPAGQSPAKKVE